MLLRAFVIAVIAALVAFQAMAAPAYDPVGDAYQWLWPQRAPKHVPFPTTPAELPPPFIEPPPAVSTPPVVETKTPEPPAKPKTKRITVTPRDPEKRKPKVVQQHSLPSCAIIRREYDRMSYGERLAAYTRATPAEVAHGKRCLGM